MPWQQIYDPLNSTWLSTAAALLPAVVLLGCLGLLRLRAHWAALAGLGCALLVALAVYRMPAGMALSSSLYGAAYGLLPIGWIIFTTILLYRLSDARGLFTGLRRSLMRITPDPRLQLILVAFCFGSFLEGAAGFGTPVVVTASILIGLGFPALPAAGLALLANTAPVPFASLGTPLVALQSVTGLDLHLLTSTVALQLTLFDLILPFWLVAVFSGLKSAWQVAPALLVAGGSYAVTQYAIARLHGPWLVNILSALVSLAALTLFLRVWKPRHAWRFEGEARPAEADAPLQPGEALRGWAPWLILSVLVFVWGLPQVRSALDSISLVRIPIAGLHLLAERMPPVTAQPQPQNAVFDFAWLSASGTAILLAALITAAWLKFSPRELFTQAAATFKQVRFTLLTLCAMLAMGFVIRYAGMDGTLGLTFARTGALYPFFGTLLGWLGVVITGSDTSSNVLFGSLQRITAEQLGLQPEVMAAANTSGGVMGKMINAQSLVVAGAATGITGREGEILRYVFFHSLALAAMAGLIVMAMAYWG